MTTEQILAAAMSQRTKQGLALNFRIPDRADLFTCYPKDDVQKAMWLERAKVRGWALVQ